MTMTEHDIKEIESLKWFQKELDRQLKLGIAKPYPGYSLFEDDICWCFDSDRCDNTDCFRHMNNRKTAGIFTGSALMGTEYCENNKE